METAELPIEIVAESQTDVVPQMEPDTKGRITFEINGDKITFRTPDGEESTFDDPQVKYDTEQREKSAAQRRIDRLKARRGDCIQEHRLDGEVWYIKLLSWPELSRVGVMMKRNPDGSLGLGEESALEALTVAMLEVCVVSGTDDPAPYFTHREACEYVNEPEAKYEIARLFNLITELNPDILPSKKK